MTNDIVSYLPHELAELARKHHTSVTRVKEVIRENLSATREQLEAALDRRSDPWWLPVKAVPKTDPK